MKKTIVLLVTFVALTLSPNAGQNRPDVLDLPQGLGVPAQSLPEALALVELYCSSERAWLDPGADYLIYSSDFERAFAVYGDGYCLQQMAGWEGFKVETGLEEYTWFIGYQHPQLAKQVVFRVMRDGSVTVLVAEDTLLMAGR